MENTVERLHHLRKTILHMTQAEFSGVIGISRSNYANIEKGNIGLSQRIVRDICREFAVRRLWLLEGEEPIFEPQTQENGGGIGALFSQLTTANQKAVESQIQHMLNEQKGLAAAFAGGVSFAGDGSSADDASSASNASKGETLSSEEIRLLKEMLAQRVEQAPKSQSAVASKGGDK